MSLFDWISPTGWTEAEAPKTALETAIDFASENSSTIATGTAGIAGVAATGYAGKKLLNRANVSSSWIPSMPTVGSITSRLPSMPTLSTFTSRIPSMPAVGSLTSWMPSMPTLSSVTSRIPAMPSVSSLTSWIPSMPSMPSFKRADAPVAATVAAAAAVSADNTAPAKPGIFAAFGFGKKATEDKAVVAEVVVDEKPLAELQAKYAKLTGQYNILAKMDPRGAQKIDLQRQEIEAQIQAMQAAKPKMK